VSVSFAAGAGELFDPHPAKISVTTNTAARCTTISAFHVSLPRVRLSGDRDAQRHRANVVHALPPNRNGLTKPDGLRPRTQSLPPTRLDSPGTCGLGPTVCGDSPLSRLKLVQGVPMVLNGIPDVGHLWAACLLDPDRNAAAVTYTVLWLSRRPMLLATSTQPATEGPTSIGRWRWPRGVASSPARLRCGWFRLTPAVHRPSISTLS